MGRKKSVAGDEYARPNTGVNIIGKNSASGALSTFTAFHEKL
jgi:hypothetical protein